MRVRGCVDAWMGTKGREGGKDLAILIGSGIGMGRAGVGGKKGRMNICIWHLCSTVKEASGCLLADICNAPLRRHGSETTASLDR